MWGRSFRLDESMFERLIREKTLLPAQLNVQRRIRPEISTLVRNTLYEDPEDRPSAGEYPDCCQDEAKHLPAAPYLSRSQSQRLPDKVAQQCLGGQNDPRACEASCSPGTL